MTGNARTSGQTSGRTTSDTRDNLSLGEVKNNIGSGFGSPSPSPVPAQPSSAPAQPSSAPVQSNGSVVSDYASSVFVASPNEAPIATASEPAKQPSASTQSASQAATMKERHEQAKPATMQARHEQAQPAQAQARQLAPAQQRQQSEQAKGTQASPEARTASGQTNQLNQVQAAQAAAQTAASQQGQEAQEQSEMQAPTDAVVTPGSVTSRVSPAVQQSSTRSRTDADIIESAAKPSAYRGRRHPSFASRAFDTIKNRLAGKRTVPTGNNVNTKVITHPDITVGIREVSVGTDILLDSIRQDSVLLDRVNAYAAQTNLKDDFKFEDFLGSNEQYMLGQLADVINRLEIPVVLSKSPISEQTSMQKRILRVHSGQGISIHPLAAKGYVADFDGDGATVHFGEELLGSALDAMECLYSIDGKTPLIDFDFMLLPDIDVDLFTEILEERGVQNARQIAKALKAKDAAKFADAVISIDRFSDRAYAIDIATMKASEIFKQGILETADRSEYRAPSKVDALDLRPDEKELWRIIETAKMPPNYQDFVTALSRFNSDIAGKNPHFRVGADLGKLIKFDQDVFVGEEGLRKLYQSTCKAVNAKIMSGKAFMGEERQSISEWKQVGVINYAGFLSNFDGSERDFAEWYENFRLAYNEYTAMAEMSKHQFRMDMSAIKVEIHKTSLPELSEVNAGELAKAVIEIYGDFSMERVFGFKRKFGAKRDDNRGDMWNASGYRRAMLSKYASMSVRKFSQSNHCVTKRKPNEAHFTGEEFTGEEISGSMQWEILFEAIADHRSSKASEYNKNLKANLAEQITILELMRDALRRRDKEQDHNSYYLEAQLDLENRTKLLASCGPDIYAYFGMESTDSFLESEWGKLMAKANTADQLGGIRYAMVAEYRLDKLANLIRRQSEQMTETERDEIQVQIEAELMILGSSSDVWSAIKYDICTQNELWNTLTSAKAKAVALYAGPNAKSNAVMQGFEDMLDSSRWPTAIDFLCDPMVGKEAKDAVLSDLARMNERYERINGFEVALMLEASPSSTYAGSNTLGWSESSDDVLKSSLDNMRRPEDISYYDGLDLTDAEIVQVLDYLKEPSNYVMIEDSMYADAVAAAMDKTYDDTEKSKQQAAVNALYTALSYQINGGLYSDVYRGDNKALGRLAWDQVSPMDLIRALSDPSFEILVYDEAGNTAVLSCEALCGGSSPEAIGEFLRNNPRLFAFMRGMTVSVQDGSDGNAVLSSRMSIHETLRAAESGTDRRAKALSVLRDHPGWGAMCALFTPVHGRSSRNQRFSIQMTEQSLLEALSYYRKTGEMPDLSGLKKYDKRLRKIVENLFMKYASEVDTTDIKATRMNTMFDAESVNMFYDARQILSGAKTAVSTGVEGAETKKTAASFPFFAHLESVYTTDENDNVVPSDGSDRVSGPLKRIFVNPFAKFFAVKRSKGGEEFNLKAKKAGDDGLDSITKSRKYSYSATTHANGVKVREGDTAKTWGMFVNELNAAYGKDGDIAAAEKMLGDWLMECNHELKYEDMDAADYANIAHLLIKETADGIIVRSLGQISAAIRHQLPSYMDVSSFRDAPLATILQHSQTISDSCGMGEADILGILYGMKLPSTARFKPATRQRSSSKERNFQLITALEPIMRNAPASDKAKWLTPDQRQDKHNAFRKRVQESDLKWAIGSDGYGIMGVFDGKNDDWQAMPGAANLLVVTEDASQDSFAKAADIARKYGMTLVFPTSMTGNVTPFMRQNMIPEPDGSKDYMMIPYFDIRLNGFGEATSGRTIFDESNVVVSVEDSLNEHGLGDASAVITQAMYDRINVKKSGEWQDDATDMFAVTMNRYEGKNFEFRMATPKEIKDNIINWSYPDIDIRVEDMNGDFDPIFDKVSRQIAEFQYNWDMETSVIKGRPDRIVGWAAMDIRDQGGKRIHTTFAPITPFTRYKDNTKTVPQEFDVNNISFDANTGNYVMSWTHNGSLVGQFLKMFEGLAAGNKMMAFTKPVRRRQLKSGREIDVMYAANTTSSRRLGWNARLQTMYSMMFQARMDPYGYNFAEGGDSLPDDPELKARMLSGEIPFSEWKSMDINGIRWHKDKRINAFVKNEIKMCLKRGIHPDDFLASRYTDENGVVRNTHIYFEFDMLFKPSFRYQNDIMTFLHSMMPTLCPESINDDSEDYLFKPCKDKGWSYGCLQQQVPRLDADGNVKTYTWENVYTSFGFFSDDYSGFHSPGVDGADIMMQELAVAVQNGKVGNEGRLLGEFMDWAFSDAAPAPKPTSWRAEDMRFDKADGDFTWDPNDAVCFTGHRPDDLYGYNNDAAWRFVYRGLYKAIEEQYNAGKRVFIHGGAQGVDMIAAMAVHKFRDSHPDVKSVMAIPFEGSQGKGSDRLFGKQRYDELRNESDLAKILFEGKGRKKMYLDRNTWMLDHSSAVITAYNGREDGGGTFDTISKARRKKMNIVNILKVD